MKQKYIKINLINEYDMCRTLFLEVTNLSREEQVNILEFNNTGRDEPGSEEDPVLGEDVEEFLINIGYYLEEPVKYKGLITRQYSVGLEKVDQLDHEINLSGGCPSIIIYIPSEPISMRPLPKGPAGKHVLRK